MIIVGVIITVVVFISGVVVLIIEAVNNGKGN